MQTIFVLLHFMFNPEQKNLSSENTHTKNFIHSQQTQILKLLISKNPMSAIANEFLSQHLKLTNQWQSYVKSTMTIADVSTHRSASA